MTIRLYIDDDFLEKALVGALRHSGVNVETAQDVGLDGHDDEEHLIYAAEQDRVLCSFNKKDFCRIHKEWMDQGKSHAGMILAQQQKYDVGERVRRIMKIIAAKSAEDMRNGLEFL